jgi:hypothetical protein
MSKDSVDKPDEYESIFDENDTVKSAGDSNPSFLDAEIIDTSSIQSENLDDLSDIDSVNKKENSDFLDTDIEDGIFAPERKVIKSPKKSSHLMLSVSILAIIGVAGFVYISNPDLLSKVTGNLANNTEVVLPQEVLPDVDSSEKSNEANDKANIATNEAEQLIIPQVEGEVDVKPDLQVEKITTTEASPTIETLVEPKVEESIVEAKVEPVINPPKESVELNAPKDLTSPPDASVETPDSVMVPQEQISAIDKKEEISTPVTNTSISPPSELNEKAADEKVAAVQEMTVAAPQTKTVKVEDVKVDPKAANDDVSTEKIIVVNSKEEQKILDDAKLDQYFDSPNGKMLKEIPAPSMDPKKGSGESIIIVNKKPIPPTLSKKIEIETKDLSREVISANRALKLGRYEAANEMYEDLYRVNPKDEGILSGRALVFQKMGMNQQAIAAYEQLLKLYPNNIDAIVNLSGIIRKEYPAVALNKLLDLREKYPNNVFVIAQLGVTYADAGNFQDAIKSLITASEMDPQNPLHFYNLAVILEKASEPKEAIKNYEKALEVDSIFGEGKKQVSREKIYDRLAFLRRN